MLNKKNRAPCNIQWHEMCLRDRATSGKAVETAVHTTVATIGAIAAASSFIFADGGESGMTGGFHSLSGGSRMAAEAVQQPGGRGNTDSNGALQDVYKRQLNVAGRPVLLV